MGAEKREAETAMRACFVSLATEMNLSWESMRYPGPRALLDAFRLRSIGFCLAVELKADFWVVKWEGGKTDFHPRAIRLDPDGVKRIVGGHKNVVSLDEIPWGEYDFVISYAPFIPAQIIKQHPRTLWVYREVAGRSPRADAALGRPYGAYDLFVDTMLRCPSTLKALPQSLGMPYMQNPDTMREVVKPTLEPAVFLDSRMILQDPVANARMCTEHSNVCGMPVRHSPIKDQTTQPIRFYTDVTMARVPRLAEYLKVLGSCKYMLVREGKSRVAGDSAIEAAALGLIVIIREDSIYGPMMCHPMCLLPPNSQNRTKLRLVRKIERHPELQAEILSHQDKAMRAKFWKEPLETLYAAAEMKNV